jgi:formylglycine-generating enzyme required for sulfatase activity
MRKSIVSIAAILCLLIPMLADAELPIDKIALYMSFDDVAGDTVKDGSGNSNSRRQFSDGQRSGIEGAKYTWGNSDPNNRTANFADSNTRFEWRSQEINDSFLFVAPVGSFQPNGYGLFDMAGNLWEWCSDWYGASYYAESPRENPKGPPTGERRVLRSGAWYRSLHTIRSAERVSDYPDSNLNVIGFRCAMDAP